MQVLFSSFGDANHTTSSRICVFSHFDPNNRIAPYVFDYLKKLKDVGFELLVVSTSLQLKSADVEELKRFCSACILRENKGYDFGSYKTGIGYLNFNKIKPTSLLIANDSVFGPFSSLKALLSKHLDDTGMLGLTDSYDHGYHLQSYFIHFGRDLLNTDRFTEFWDSVELEDHIKGKSAIIKRYEVGGTKFFRDNGASITSIFPFEDVADHSLVALKQKLKKMKEPHSATTLLASDLNLNLNSTHRYWNLLIERGYPFIKRELLVKNPIGADIEQWPERISRHTKYDLSLIAEALLNTGHLSRLYDIRLSEVVNHLSKRDAAFPARLFGAFHQFGLSKLLPDQCLFRFDEIHYLNLYPDVALAVNQGRFASGQEHYVRHGYGEERNAAFIVAT